MENAFAGFYKVALFSGTRTGWTQTLCIVRARVWSIRSYSVDKMGDNGRYRADWSAANLLVEQQAAEAEETPQTRFEDGIGI